MMTTPSRTLIVIGGGIVGVSTAISARISGRYGKITIYDANRIVEDADDDEDWLSSTDDVSKILRGDYGSDGVYAELFYNRALAAWKKLFPESSESHLHLNGVLLLSTVPLTEAKEENSSSSFERDCLKYFENNSHQLMNGRFPPPRVYDSAEALKLDERTKLFHNFNGGYLNFVGGWGESGRILRTLLKRAREEFDVEVM